ncbi:MAG: TVP38/TMEM64 family protein, partial [Thermoanaerobaculia bacterium]
AEWVDSLGVWGPVVFIVGYAVGTVAFVPGSILTMASGAIFGLVYGTIYTIIGAIVGVTIAFLVARFVVRRQIEDKIAGNEKFAAIDRAIAAQGGKIVFLLRLSPAFPYNLLNYALGLTKVPLLQYVLASVGMLPGTFLYVYYGKAIGSLSAIAAGEAPEHGNEQWAFLALGLIATIAVTAVVTKIARRALAEAADV